MNYEQIFIGNSVFAEFLYLLKFPQKVKNTLFLTGPSCVEVDVPNKLPIVGPRVMNFLPQYKEMLQAQLFLLLKGKILPCYGNVETIFSGLIINLMPFYPISNGLWDIQKFPKYLQDPSHFVKCYAVKYSDELNVSHERLEYIDMKKLWERLSNEEQNIFVKRFGILDDTISLLKTKKNILVTQPLSEDNIISERDKIELYVSILSKYNHDDIIIKPHPRESTDWSKIFNSIPVIPKLVPMELIELLVPNLKKMITFFSTSGCTDITPKEIDFYAKDFSKLKMMENGRYENGKIYQSAATFDVEQALKNKKNFNWLRIPDNKFYKP